MKKIIIIFLLLFTSILTSCTDTKVLPDPIEEVTSMIPDSLSFSVSYQKTTDEGNYLDIYTYELKSNAEVVHIDSFPIREERSIAIYDPIANKIYYTDNSEGDKVRGSVLHIKDLETGEVHELSRRFFDIFSFMPDQKNTLIVRGRAKMDQGMVRIFQLDTETKELNSLSWDDNLEFESLSYDGQNDAYLMIAYAYFEASERQANQVPGEPQTGELFFFEYKDKQATQLTVIAGSPQNHLSSYSLVKEDDTIYYQTRTAGCIRLKTGAECKKVKMAGRDHYYDTENGKLYAIIGDSVVVWDIESGEKTVLFRSDQRNAFISNLTFIKGEARYHD